MKVPIRYKSSDRYNAGVDVVYDDESKLQYAPFVYATTASGDNGGDGGDDEEGEDSMVIHLNAEGTALDKSWSEIKNAVDDGKVCVLVDDHEENNISIKPLYNVYNVDSVYGCVFSFYVTENTFNSVEYTCDSADGFPVHIVGD